ncbi:hypothetical protein [Prosthecobacter sp.]|uniref:hypothetical protein n=1 Tax=Prosthecobacter sp. TaxID=1965333 RepID=UPI00378300B5
MPVTVSIAEFFSSLHVSGQVGVTREALLPGDSEQTQALLSRAFQDACDDLPGGLKADLECCHAAATAAIHYLYRVCQALVDRAMSEEQVAAICAAMPPLPTSPGEMFSQDLALRHLPELWSMARSMSDSDPLVTGIEQAALRFPLSSVGIALKNSPDLLSLRRHDGLWRLYIDRIIARQDALRLEDASTALAVADALGEHAHSLAPKLAARLALASAPALSAPSILSLHP